MTRAGGSAWRLVAAILVAVQLPVLLKTASDSSQSDFANYFTPAFVLGHGGTLGELYERDGFERGLIAAGLHGLGSFVPHPPANALWLLPFAALTPELAKALWSIMLVFAVGATVAAVFRLRPDLGLSAAVVIVLAPTLAIRNGLAFGQPYLILAALLVWGVWALERGRAFVGGFLLGLGVSFKPYALGVGFLFVHPERRRTLAGFIAGAVTPSVVLWSMIGAGPFVEFTSRVLPWMIRGDIQDPFAPGWGSLSALANRVLRFEPDLNPLPWIDAPALARFIGAGASAVLLFLGVVSGRRALDAHRPLDAVGVTIAFALAASPFVASYHLVLLVVPVLAMASRLSPGALILWVTGWACLGSPLVNVFRSASGALAPLSHLRLGALIAGALIVAWPYLTRRMLGMAFSLGGLAGVFALPWSRSEEVWERIDSARGYSMVRPYFCAANLRWWSPSPDGSRLESRGSGDDCSVGSSLPRQGEVARATVQGLSVTSRYAGGSWNLYLRTETPNPVESRLTFSDANEVDPVFTPDGGAVVFASDQGRGLGSTALYRLEVSGLTAGCGGPVPVLLRR